MEVLWLQFLLFIIPPFVYLCLYLQPSRDKPNSKTGFKVHPLLGSIPELLKNRHRFLPWTTDVLSRCPTNTSVLRRPGRVQVIITANPSNVEHMLKSNFATYPKGYLLKSILEDFLGEGIFNSDGELWKIQRKTASYNFNKKSLRNFVMEIATVEIMTRLIPILKKASETKRVLDFQDTLERFAFDNVCKVAFNVDPGCLSGDGTAGGEFMRAFEEAATISFGRFLHPFQFFWKIKRFLHVGSERRLKQSIKTIHEFADKVIKSRMEETADNNDEDLLSHFIGNDGNSAKFLRDVVMNFILAGRDTTSSALSWFFWLLSTKPIVEQKILKELEIIRVRNKKHIGDPYSFDELQEMNYLHAAISEALRLYPPVPTDTKICSKDDIMSDGTFVGKGWLVMYSAYAMGRMESIWGKDCCEFRPERWLEDGTFRQESPFRFPAFHAGPRMCLGKDMAYLQMKSVAASVIELFRVDVQVEESPQHLLALTLRMKGGLPVRVNERRVR